MSQVVVRPAPNGLRWMSHLQVGALDAQGHRDHYDRPVFHEWPFGRGLLLGMEDGRGNLWYMPAIRDDGFMREERGTMVLAREEISAEALIRMRERLWVRVFAIETGHGLWSYHSPRPLSPRELGLQQGADGSWHVPDRPDEYLLHVVSGGGDLESRMDVEYVHWSVAWAVAEAIRPGTRYRVEMRSAGEGEEGMEIGGVRRVPWFRAPDGSPYVRVTVEWNQRMTVAEHPGIKSLGPVDQCPLGWHTAVLRALTKGLLFLTGYGHALQRLLAERDRTAGMADGEPGDGRRAPPSPPPPSAPKRAQAEAGAAAHRGEAGASSPGAERGAIEKGAEKDWVAPWEGRAVRPRLPDRATVREVRLRPHEPTKRTTPSPDAEFREVVDWAGEAIARMEREVREEIMRYGHDHDDVDDVRDEVRRSA